MPLSYRTRCGLYGRLCFVPVLALLSACSGSDRLRVCPPPGLVDGAGAVCYQWRVSETVYAGANAIRLQPGLWLATHHAKPVSDATLWTNDVLDELDPSTVKAMVEPAGIDRLRSVNANDWILVRTDERADARPAEIVWNSRPEIGDRVWVVGGGFGDQIRPDRGWVEIEARVYCGVVLRAPEWSVAADERESLLAFSVPGSGGFEGLSGSPVINEKGEVVAMHLGRMVRQFAWFDLETVHVARLLDDDIRRKAELP